MVRIRELQTGKIMEVDPMTARVLVGARSHEFVETETRKATAPPGGTATGMGNRGGRHGR